MAIYIRCQKCKNEFSVKYKTCPKCGELSQKQNRTYRISATHYGQRIRKTVSGSLGFVKEIEAKIKQELIAGEYYDRRKIAKERISFDEFMTKKYLPYTKDNKNIVSYKSERMLYRIWIKPITQNKTLKDVCSFDIEKMKKEMKDKGKAERTIVYAIAVIRQAFNKASQWGIYNGDNPTKGVRKPKKDNRRSRFLTTDEVIYLLNELKKHSKQIYVMALLSLKTGMRAGEIFNLKFCDIDLVHKIIHIRDPKNVEDRTAYITSDIEEILNKQGSAENFIFVDKNGKKICSVSKTFFRIVDKIGLNNGVTDRRNRVVFHTLRHTFASWLAIQGTPIYTIKELMGHKTIAMTERYAHLMPSVKKQAVADLPDLIRDHKKEHLEQEQEK